MTGEHVLVSKYTVRTLSKYTIFLLRLMACEHVLVSKYTILSPWLMIGEHVLVSKYTI